MKGDIDRHTTLATAAPVPLASNASVSGRRLKILVAIALLVVQCKIVERSYRPEAGWPLIGNGVREAGAYVGCVHGDWYVVQIGDAARPVACGATRFQALGFVWFSHPPGSPMNCRGVVVPIAWTLVLNGICLVALLLRSTTAFARSVRGRRWSRVGRCAECGYDLRSSPGRCPECGLALARNAEVQYAL